MTGEGAARRDLRVDTATGVLIIAVVFGHLLSSVPGERADILLQWLFMFHVPAFVFVSGYATRYASRWSPVDIVLRLLIPFVVFHVIHRLVIAVIADVPFSLNFPRPAWTLWYLVALCAWRLMAPALRAMGFAWAVVGGVAVSLLAGLVSWIGEPGSLGRIFGFLPFFVAGLLWRDEWWRPVLSRYAWVAGTVVLAVAGLWARANHDLYDRAAWWFSQSYAALDLGQLQGLAQRAAILVSMALLTMAVLSIAMRKSQWLAAIGAQSLVVYLLHPILLYPWHIDSAPPELGSRIGIAVALAASVVFAWVVSRPPVVRAIAPLIDYRWWVRRSRDRAPGRKA